MSALPELAGIPRTCSELSVSAECFKLPCPLWADSRHPMSFLRLVTGNFSKNESLHCGKSGSSPSCRLLRRNSNLGLMMQELAIYA